MPGLRPAPVEAEVVAHFQAATSARVGTRIPEKRPAEFVRVTRTGGARSNLVQEQPTVLVECFALTSVAAERLAGDVWAAAAGLDGAVAWVHRVELTMPVNFPDPDTETHARYQFMAQITANLEATA